MAIRPVTAPRTITRPTSSDAALGTLASEPGAFGAALGSLGFPEFRRGSSPSYGEWFSSDLGDLRVVCRPDDGDRVTLIGWDPRYPGKQLLSWSVEFTGSTPQSVVLAAIANALGDLPVTH